MQPNQCHDITMNERNLDSRNTDGLNLMMLSIALPIFMRRMILNTFSARKSRLIRPISRPTSPELAPPTPDRMSWPLARSASWWRRSIGTVAARSILKREDWVRRAALV